MGHTASRMSQGPVSKDLHFLCYLGFIDSGAPSWFPFYSSDFLDPTGGFKSLLYSLKALLLFCVFSSGPPLLLVVKWTQYNIYHLSHLWVFNYIHSRWVAIQLLVPKPFSSSPSRNFVPTKQWLPVWLTPLIAVTKYLVGRNLGEGGYIWAHGLRAQTTMAEKAWRWGGFKQWQQQQLPSHISHGPESRGGARSGSYL